MPPIRRYLRISKYSVLECRIFPENPADGPRWLLNPQDPALPRVFEAIRPLVLPKLREENERAKGKGKKKKSVKDVVKKDDFEVSMFLTEIRTRHSLLVKSKTFEKRTWPGQLPLDAAGMDEEDPLVIAEESDEESNLLHRIPSSDSEGVTDRPPSKRRKQTHAEEEDKKQLAFRTSYEGFTIWGWVLCLLVDRINTSTSNTSQGHGHGHAQALMQEWIASTQQQDDGA